MPRLSVTGTFFSTVPRNPSITRPFRPFEIRTAFVYKRFGFGFGFGFAQRRAVPSYRDEQARSKRIAMESGNGNDNNNDASSNSKDQDSEDVGARVNYSMNRDDRSMATRHRNFSQNSQFRGKRIPTSWERPFGNEWLVAGNANETDPVCNRCFENLIHQWHNSRNRSPDRNAAGKRFDFSNDSEPADRNGRHSYTALGHGPSVCEDVGECMEMEKRSRDRALSICQAYIRRTPRYSLVKQLNNLGSRVDKHWFAVRDVSLKTDRLITLAPLSSNCSLIVSSLTKNILSDLFLALQHPYICPIFDIDFLEYERENYVIVVQPISQGSLKDLIYGIERTGWNEDWSQKYAARGKGLPLPQIQQMGRQVLEALIFLKKREFPMVMHLHSGNVLVQNGVARLAGLENTLLGFTSRIHPVIASRISQTTPIDIVSFGHMLFEMCAGYELRSFKPNSMHLSDLEMYPQVIELLKYIFGEPTSRRRNIEELLVHDLFRNIDLREMRCAPVTIFRPSLTPSVANLLDGIKRQNLNKRVSGLDMVDVDALSLHRPDTVCEHSLLDEIYNELSNTAV
ncbi:slowpoke binding protein isoform X2 [Nomia melanderi]|uniref:slowpoke binding protein isoform X2 n=1 Tax=Nomia melanderi TaxID=2448451 RepID=UPI0013041D72|nr:slowpoke-binding protein isoform X2 [Nomia melanderi]